MIQLFASIHVLGLRFIDYTGEQFDVLDRARSERGSVTIEQVLWAVAVIAIVGIVTKVIIDFVTDRAGQIK